MKRKIFFLSVSLILILCITAVYAEEWICSNCGKPNTANFCTNCGQEHDVWICPGCGEENDDAFCGNCGTPKPIDLSFLYGTWKYDYDDNDSYVVFHEDGTMLVSCTYGGVGQGTYTATANQITMSVDTDDETTTQYKYIDDKIYLDNKPVPLIRSKELARFCVCLDTETMDDTFPVDTELFFECKDFSELQRFDIVAVYYPVHRKNIHVDRIVGFPGDTIVLQDGYLFVNDEKYDEPYINNEYRTGESNQFGPYTVPEGQFFVLDDHRNKAYDSRNIGALDASMFVGAMIPNPDLDIFTGQITGFHWVRTIDIEKSTDTPSSSWVLPDGATLTDQREEIYSYDSVFDHYEEAEVQRSTQVFDHNEIYYTYEDNSNGTFTEVPHERPVYTTEYYTETVQQPVYIEVPHYETKYYYTTKSWQYARQITSSGDDQNPYWPTDPISSDERQGKQSQIYTLTVSDGDSTRTYRVDESYWTSVNLGDIIFITFHRDTAEIFISDDTGNYLAPVLFQY